MAGIYAKAGKTGPSFNFGVYWSNVKRTVYLRPNLKLRYEALNSRVELSVLSCCFSYCVRAIVKLVCAHACVSDSVL